MEEQENNTILYNKQIKFDGNAYLDPKRMPIESYSALFKFPLDEIFDGMVVGVKRDETLSSNSSRYIYKNNQWQIIDTTSEIIE